MVFLTAYLRRYVFFMISFIECILSDSSYSCELDGLRRRGHLLVAVQVLRFHRCGPTSISARAMCIMFRSFTLRGGNAHALRCAQLVKFLNALM